MRSDGIFIGIEVDDDALAGTPTLAAQLEQVCPVDIYRQVDGGGLEIVDANIDECVLCRLCLDAAGASSAGDGAVRVIKLYDDGATL